MTEARAGAARPAAVVLDAGGVLVVPHPDHLRAGIPELRATGAADRAVVRAHYAGVAAIDGFGLPASWEAYCTAFLLEAGVTSAGLRSAVPALREVIQSVPGLWSYIPPGVSDGLRRLAACGVALAVVSNSDGTIEAQLRADAVCQVGEGGGTPVAVVVDSHLVGVAKPDPAIFTHALEVLGVAPAGCWYVGDTVAVDVAGARAAGLVPVHLDPFAFCRQEGHAHATGLREVAGLVDRCVPA